MKGPSFRTRAAAMALTAIAAASGCGVALAQPQATAPAPSQGLAIAGLHPDQRLPGAPRIREFAVDDALAQQRLRGVSRPWPASVERTARQAGAWFVPMFHPGMTGSYDIRALHGPSN